MKLNSVLVPHMKLVATFCLVATSSFSYGGSVNYISSERWIEGHASAHARDAAGALGGSGDEGFTHVTGDLSPAPLTASASVDFSDDWIGSLARANTSSTLERTITFGTTSALISGRLHTEVDAQNDNGASPFSPLTSTALATAQFTFAFTLSRPHLFHLAFSSMLNGDSAATATLAVGTTSTVTGSGLLEAGEYTLIVENRSLAYAPSDGVLRTASAESWFSLSMQQVSPVPTPTAWVGGIVLAPLLCMLRRAGRLQP